MDVYHSNNNNDNNNDNNTRMRVRTVYGLREAAGQILITRSPPPLPASPRPYPALPSR